MLRVWQYGIRRQRTALMSLWLNSHRLIISTSAETTATCKGQQEEQRQEECNNNNNVENECQNERITATNFYNISDVSSSQEHHEERESACVHRLNVELMKCQVVKGLNNHVKLCQEQWMEMEPQDKCTILYKLGLHALELIEYDKDEELQKGQEETTNIAQRIKSVYKQLHINWRSNKKVTDTEHDSGTSDRVCAEETLQETNSHCMERHESQWEPYEQELTQKVKEEICQSTCHNVNGYLPYVMRLKLSLSFAMWIATLRSAQLEFISSKLPYAPTRRVNRTKSSPPTQKIQDTLAFVYPRCFFDKLINWSIEVVVRVNSNRNPTALQAPAPHTWQSDMSELIQDEEEQANNKSYFENEENTTKHINTKGRYGLLSNRRAAWHPFTHRRSNNKQKQQMEKSNKDATALISRRTRALRSAHKAPHRAGADDSIWAITHAQSQRRARRHHDGLLFTQRHEKAPWQSTSGWMKFIASYQNPYRSIPCVEDNPNVESIHFDTNAMFDALFHGNYNREEGCPVNNNGNSTATPIFIQVHLENNYNTRHSEQVHVNKYEMLTHYCVMAHAAVLTSLFIEGRVAHFFTDNKDLYQYVILVFQELIERQYLSVQLVEYVRTLTITPESVNSQSELLSDSSEDNKINNDAEKEVVYLMPYYPDYAQPKLSSVQQSISRHALILVPPENGYYNKNVARQLARLIVQAAPCTVIVETEYEQQESTQKEEEKYEEEEQNEEICKENKCTRRYKYWYVKQIREEVNILKAELCHREEQCQIKWEALRMEMHMDKKTESKRVEEMSEKVREGNKQPIFQPKLQQKTQNKKLSLPGYIIHLSHSLWSKISKYNYSTKNNECEASTVTSFSKKLSESNALNHYYSLQFLTAGNNFAQRKTLQKELYDFLYNKLPSNVRVVGINTSPFDILYYYPQAPFLQRKAGNSQRYKAVDLAVISKSTSIYDPDSLKLLHASRYHKTDSDIFSSYYSLSDRTHLAKIEYIENNEHIRSNNGRYGEDNTKDNDIKIKNAATIELIIQYLITGSPIKAVLAILTKILHL